MFSDVTSTEEDNEVPNPSALLATSLTFFLNKNYFIYFFLFQKTHFFIFYPEIIFSKGVVARQSFYFYF